MASTRDRAITTFGSKEPLGERWLLAVLTLALATACSKPPTVTINEAVQQGAVEATVTGTSVRIIDLEGPSGAQQTDEPILIIEMQVKNVGTSPVRYDLGWELTTATQAQAPLLFIDEGPETELNPANNVPSVLLTSLDYEADPIDEATTIAPGEAVEDLLLFHVPPPGTSQLILTLPPRMFGPGVKLPARVRIPFSRPEEVPGPPSVGLDEAFEGDGFSFTLESADVLYAPLRDSTRGDGFSNAPLLRLSFTVENTSDSTIAYIPSRVSGGIDPPMLVDDDGQILNRATFDPNVVIVGQISERTQLGPGESLEDFVLYERPPASVSKLHLTVPAKRVGSTGLIRVSFPYRYQDPPLPEALRPPSPDEETEGEQAEE